MNKRLQGFVVGTLLGMTIASSTALAVNTTTLYGVLMNGIKIVVDGEKLNPKDVNGKTVEPFIYNGTTYLPVRAVADALGKSVYWDGPNYTVYLGDMGGSLEYPTTYLKDMLSIADKISSKYGDLTDNYGNRYENYADDGYYGNCKLEYLLNMKYDSFKGTLYIPKGESRDGSAFIQIIADGKTIYTSPEMTKTSSPVYVDVSLRGYNDVIIQYSAKNITVCLGNAGFYQ